MQSFHASYHQNQESLNLYSVFAIFVEASNNYHPPSPPKVDVPKVHGDYCGINVTSVQPDSCYRVSRKLCTTAMPVRPLKATSAPDSLSTEKVETVLILSCQFNVGSTATFIG